MMFHGHNILVSTRRDAFEADARAARLAREARTQRHVTSTFPVRREQHSAASRWQALRIRWEMAQLERAVAKIDERNLAHDYVDCK